MREPFSRARRSTRPGALRPAEFILQSKGYDTDRDSSILLFPQQGSIISFENSLGPLLEQSVAAQSQPKARSPASAAR